MYHVYILKCADNSLYTGITTDLVRRVQEHNGKLDGGAKYTAARRPVKLVYSTECKDRSSASKEEWRIKQFSRKQKEQLLKQL